MISVSARYMLLSALGFSLMGVFVKMAHQRGIPILEIVAARALVSLILSYVDVKRKGIPLLGTHKTLLFSRGLVGAIALLCVYTSLAYLPFAEATVLQFLHPAFTAVLAFLFLREKLSAYTALCIALSFSGLVLISRPEFLFSGWPSELPLWAIAVAIAGALGSAIAYVLVRKLSNLEDSSVIIVYFPMIALPFSLLLLGDDFVMPEGISWLILLFVGVATQVGQIGLTKSMQTASAATATSFSYLQVVFAVIFGIWFFGEVPSVLTLIGAGLIVLGAFVNLFAKVKA